MKLAKDKYNSGEKFENPYPEGERFYVLHIYPDPRYNNNWVAALSGEGQDITDLDRIIINKEIMKRRIAFTSENQTPYITRDEIIKLLTNVLSKFNTGRGFITFTS